ncbi:tctex1 domain-containing protein 1-A-like [Mizuhopecten yessoensis]|uniref:Tctex1 domain-containing protein 1-A n=1 Tax=Mizuhopecten yessoensis TaxID=6573 RepID=A0A210Q714_MIZYE|nr:tctex1 domain-containing protein 1-A-like [Mizuhopecten yessoensis]OWF44530.1 Tctex1 domain-containing protein 1-A [Mizuhopecten yessoensis]
MAQPESPSQASATTADSKLQSGDGDTLVTQWKQRRTSIMSKASSGVQIDESKPVVSNRRRSTFKGIASSITSLLQVRRATKGRLSIPGLDELKFPKEKMENTYKMQPDQGQIFKTNDIKSIAQEVMEQTLHSVKYNSSICNRLVCDISQTIKNRVRGLNMARYRVVVYVFIGQCNGQSTMQMASRCVWDASTDNFCTTTYTNDSLVAVASVYGVYYE